MAIQAQFLTIKWENSDEKLMLIETLNYSFGVKTETKSSSGGNDKVLLKGYKADAISITYTANRLCGADPEEEHSKACKLLGQKGTFILGQKRLGPLKTMLMAVKPSNVIYADDGTMISITLTLSLGEPDEQKSKGKNKKKKKGKKKGKTSTIDVKHIQQLKKEKGI